MNQNDKHDYTVPQVAKLFACSSNTVKSWIKTGKLKAYRLGGSAGRDYRIPWAEVERVKADWACSPDQAL